MTKREPGIDLIRCTGLLFVIGVHSFLKNGFYFEPQMGAAIWAADSFRWLFYGCNGIFMMLTGYLKGDRPSGRHYYKGLIPILLSYLLTCIISYPIRHFLLGEKLPLSDWLFNFITFSNYSWYLEMYIGLILISPIINLAFSQMKSTGQVLWFAGTMVVLTALPSITALSLIPDYWVSLYPLTYYVLGAAVHRLRPTWKPVLCIAGALLISAGLGLASLLSTNGKFSDGFTCGYGGFWVTVTVFLLFIGLYQVNPSEKISRLLAWMAGGCLEGYILSRLLDVWVYALLPQWHTPSRYPLLFLTVSIPIYLCALLAGKAVHSCTAGILAHIPSRK